MFECKFDVVNNEGIPSPSQLVPARPSCLNRDCSSLLSFILDDRVCTAAERIVESVLNNKCIHWFHKPKVRSRQIFNSLK